MDAGGLSHMTYNYSSDNNLGVPGSGYASRGKAGHIKRLSFAPPSTIDSIYEEEADTTQSPRTNRSSLLAGLRTAHRQSLAPSPAPHYQAHHRAPSDLSGYNVRNNARLGHDMPQTATASAFPGLSYNQYGSGQQQQQQQYCLPDQVLAPPDLGHDHNDQMDPQLYNDLLAQNLYLAQRQQQLQQQLLDVTAAAQQFQGLNLNGHRLPASSITPQMSTYNQQLQHGMQPVIQAVHDQPGLFSVFNPMTGQHSYFMDPNAQQSQLSSSPPYSGSPSEADNTVFYSHEGGLASQVGSNIRQQNRSVSPPKKSVSPNIDVAPLPPPSANAFRPGHRKTNSVGFNNNGKTFAQDGVKSPAPLRSTGFPQTPMSGTFGPGMARAGEHPTRQPQGPPPLEELISAPTSKHEGSKNFAKRQRRRALNSLVRASNERRSGRGSGGAGTPSSETEINFTISDVDFEGGNCTSGRLSAPGFRPGSARGAIGSEWKELKERSRERSERGTSSPRSLAGSRDY